MELREIHMQVKEMVPEAGVVKVQHSYINNICAESWDCQCYLAAPEEFEIDVAMFMVHQCRSVDELLAAVRVAYDKYDPEATKQKEIAKLKRQLAQLGGA